MKRTVIKIDETLCNGCGLCVAGCHEGALQIIDGKARVISDSYCDGLGACIGQCPQNAIELIEKETEPFNLSGCPSAKTMTFEEPNHLQVSENQLFGSSLRQWPIQLHLVSPAAPYFQNADVVLAADCAAFSFGNFHARFLEHHSLAIACPKLDDKTDYVEKLIDLIDAAKINTLTVIVMEVPCCGGLLQLALKAKQTASRNIPVKCIVLSLQGEIIKEEWCS
ncbi:MAG: 4Fe-4S dicluster domain-containing protein [Bacteroidales bacterium]|jgi:ferredoxin|nr:4Fe-4S dicluster domain-containing protein [Bacteroidales bacterium]